jgi:hypothetical protein
VAETAAPLVEHPPSVTDGLSPEELELQKLIEAEILVLGARYGHSNGDPVNVDEPSLWKNRAVVDFVDSKSAISSAYFAGHFANSPVYVPHALGVGIKECPRTGRVLKPILKDHAMKGRVLIFFDPEAAYSTSIRSLSADSAVRCDDENCNCEATPADFQFTAAPKRFQQLNSVGFAVGRPYRHSGGPRKGMLFNSLNRNTLRNLPSLLTDDCFGGMLEVDCIDDDRRTILGADVVNLAKSLVPEAVDLQGIANTVNKNCSRDGDKRANSFVSVASAYKMGIEQLVGDDVWGGYATEKRFDLWKERALFLYERSTAAAGDGSWVVDPKPVCTPPTAGGTYNLDPDMINTALRLYVDANRTLHVRFLTKHRAGKVLKLDYTFNAAVHLGSGDGEKVLLTIMDEEDNVVCVLFCPSTKLFLIRGALQQLYSEGFHPLIVSLDNVPTSDDVMATSMMKIFTEAMPTIKYWIQDLFHCVAGFTKVFPSQNVDWFHNNVTLPIRNAMRQMDPIKEAELRLRLERGNVKITSTFRGEKVVIGKDGIRPTAIDSLVSSGHFHKMFCSGHRCVVPMLFKSRDVMMKCLWGVHRALAAELFDEHGVQQLVGGAYMLGPNVNNAQFKRKFANFTKRAANCIPPRDVLVKYYSEIPRPGLMSLVKYKLMTGSNESLHSRVGAVGGATNSSKEFKHAHAIIAITEMMRRKEAKEGTCPIGHLDFGINFETNEMARTSAVLAGRMPVPTLATDMGVDARSALVLRHIARPLCQPGSKAALRQVNPFGQSKLDGNVLVSGITSSCRVEGAASLKVPQAAVSRKHKIDDCVDIQVQKKAKASSTHYKNRYPCNCKPDTRSSTHLLTCARKKRAGRESTPKAGELVEYLPTAAPLVGSMCFPKETKSNRDWVRVGVQCTACKGFDKAGQFSNEIDMLKLKFSIKIKLCSC